MARFAEDGLAFRALVVAGVDVEASGDDVVGGAVVDRGNAWSSCSSGVSTVVRGSARSARSNGLMVVAGGRLRSARDRGLNVVVVCAPSFPPPPKIPISP